MAGSLSCSLSVSSFVWLFNVVVLVGASSRFVSFRFGGFFDVVSMLVVSWGSIMWPGRPARLEVRAQYT